MGKSHRNYTTAGRTVELQGGFSAMLFPAALFGDRSA